MIFEDKDEVAKRIRAELPGLPDTIVPARLSISPGFWKLGEEWRLTFRVPGDPRDWHIAQYYSDEVERAFRSRLFADAVTREVRRLQKNSVKKGLATNDD